MIKLCLSVIVALAVTTLPALAEDWTSTDGKTYQDVKIIKVEADCVTILDSDGGARIELAKLPSDVQKKLGYDPEKAKAAAEQRAAEDKANAVALQAEMNQAEAQKQAKLETDAQRDENTEANASLYAKWETDISNAPANSVAILQNNLAGLKKLIAAAQYSLQQKQKLVDAVRTHAVFVGMPRDFVLLSLGAPNSINKSTNANGTSEQLVFSANGGLCSEYVYLENGLVTSTQTQTATSPYLPAPVVNSIQSVGGG